MDETLEISAALRYLPIHLNPRQPNPRYPSNAARAWLGINRIYCRGYHSINVLTPCPLPRSGPAIVVCNHTSGLDPYLLQAVIPRIVTWMMAKEYYELRAIRWVFEMVQAIPVERSGRDLTATRSALRALADGRAVGIFPEGKIETGSTLLPFQTGVALLAIKTRAPVYPIYLEGSQRGMEMAPAFLIANRAALAFGPPVEFDRRSTSKQSLESATEAIQQAVESLRSFTLSEMRRYR
jgi:1-acyl-sn-glycerol-3-phosphate acyltransferase